MAENVEFDEEKLNGYDKEYSDSSLWEKIRDQAASIGMELIYKALQLYYVAQSPSCPAKVKAGIFGALGYLILPLDIIPDIVPVAGYTDDAAAIGAALFLAQAYITEDIKTQAKEKIRDIFGDVYAEKL